MFPIAILAGGLATRLRPITENVPKALIEVAGKPFIAWQLEYLRAQGANRIVLCVGYLGEMVQDVVGTGERFGLQVSYSFDGSKLLGTGGALQKALPQLDNNFFVLYGDSYLPINFSAVEEAYSHSRQQALMTVLKNGDRWDKSNVLFDGSRLIEYNKYAPRTEMEFIDYGLGILSSEVFDSYPVDQPFDLADIYQKLSLQGQLAGFEVYDRFYEIGSHKGLGEAEEYFLLKENV